MPYITKDFYIDEFSGELVDDTDFPMLLDRASEIVEEMCMYRISEDNLKNYSTDVQTKVKKAICAQIEYLDANGGCDMDMGADFQSAGLGKFNYAKSTDSKQSLYAPRAMRYLFPTGLLYRGAY